MSTRKRPLGEISNPPPSAAQTPRRYAPSTPHAIRALQQRSGAKTRSVRPRRFVPDEVDPASARGVLRRLAKITAPSTRPLRTPPTTRTGKENLRPANNVDDDEDDDDERELKKPRMTLDIDESMEESIEEEPPKYAEYEDENGEDSELPEPPTPSVLPEERPDPTITFQSIDFARQSERRNSRTSLPAATREESPDHDATTLTERGRRAVTEDATGRLSRYSFGSFRMSDFGPELEIARDSGASARLSEAHKMLGRKSAPQDVILDETQDLSKLIRLSAGNATDLEPDVPVIADDDFQLEMPQDETIIVEQDRRQPALAPEPDDGWEDIDAAEAAEEPLHMSPKSKRRLTEMQYASSRQETGRRRGKVKMTKHGTLAPALPTSLIKKIATEVQTSNGRRKPAFGPDHTKALEQATEWFFEQIGEDLAAYSSHGRRKRRIDASDVLMLMQRQRVALGAGELKTLAQKWLPKDVLATLDLPDE